MTFYAFGVNHLRAPVEVREAFSLDEEGKRQIHRGIRLSSGSELLLLSTCNRTEAYLYGIESDVALVKGALSGSAGMAWPDAMAFSYQDEDAVRHVLEVAAGLKSLVLGDAQIFAQLKEAYRIAVEEHRVDTTMHRLLHTAFRTAKRVINETELSTGAASIPYRAVEAAKVHFHARAERSLSELSALIVGSGSMGRLAAEALRLEGVKDLAFCNRSDQRGRTAADRYHARYVAWENRHAEAARVDVVIVATSAPDPVLYLDPFEKEVGDRHVMLLDISVPRNVERGIDDLPNVDVVNVDRLETVGSGAQERRRSAVPDARRIVDEMLGEFVSWVFHHQALQPAIEAIAETFEAIRAQEVGRHHQRLTDSDQAELDRITRSIIQKILAVPIVRLKSVDPESIDFVHGVRLLHALFRRRDCDDESGSAGDISGESDGSLMKGLSDEVSANGPRQDCPIDPQLPTDPMKAEAADLNVDEVLRLFSRGNADSKP